MKINLFWFRRDLKLEDNIGLMHALSANLPVLPLFIFDDHILNHLNKDDARVSFIHQTLEKLDIKLKSYGSGLLTKQGDPFAIWKTLCEEYAIDSVFFNHDYEPAALERDKEISELLKSRGIKVSSFKDQVIFEKAEVVKADQSPYTVFTPYKRKWLEHFSLSEKWTEKPLNSSNFYPSSFKYPELEEIGFVKSKIEVPQFKLDQIEIYGEKRDYPAENVSSFLGTHLRFGTVSIRKLMAQLNDKHAVFQSELIWREFFMQILFHFPRVVENNFQGKFDGIKWRNNENEFRLWCEGNTGYPIVDAGMRELNETGLMHNRVRMITASFLCKHLLIDWKWGEAYFAEKLLDYELSSNNGNWQWAAGTGCDAAPYFRVFNPTLQQQKFDKNLVYIKKWIPELNSLAYPMPMVDHKMARERALRVYNEGIIRE